MNIKNNKVCIILPARIGSTRLERKPLQLIGDQPLIWWVWKNIKNSKYSENLYIATDDEKIKKTAENFGAKVIMTQEDCQSGSDRVYQAAKSLNQEFDAIVNLQGDEPLMPLEILEKTIDLFLSIQNQAEKIATASVPFTNEEERKKQSCVKVVATPENKSLYFSRGELAASDLHLGLYVYSPSALDKFCKLEPSRLEKAEKLEQLRALENNIPIYLYRHPEACTCFGIDTPEDLEKASKILL